MIALALASAPPSPFRENVPIDVYGAGGNSCAFGFKNNVNYEETFDWIMGYWTGLQAGSGVRISPALDGYGIAEEVSKLCRDNPSMTIMEATNKTYLKLLRR